MEIVMIRSLTLLFVMLCNLAHASDHAGTIDKWEGDVLVYSGQTVKGSKVDRSDTPFRIGDSIRTKRGSIAFIRFIDGSRVVLKENSSLTVTGIDRVNVDKGRVLFEIKKRGRAKGLEITSATVTMGVKGTRFAVDNENDQVAIFLKEGQLEIGSLEEDFKRSLSGLKDDFETMHEDMKRDFDSTSLQMKHEFQEADQQMKDGNIESISEFLMNEGSAVLIENGNLKDLDFPDDLDQDFSLLDSF